EVKDWQDILCGSFRKGHFRGVATVVAKLFNISRADRAYFGMKDFQQLKIIEKMAKDLNLTTKIVPCSIIREKSGLALSSRNTYLNDEQKKEASLIHKILKQAKEEFKTKGVNVVLTNAFKKLENIKESKIDYAKIVDFADLSKADDKTKKAIFLIAMWIGKTRLIDNMIISKNTERL
ncbi:MAG: pantoate--beta-alanine ligase, partial [Elusimicrobiota bacterium]|nr:pantoate--beta-alanine ligase [Elusimicrobiota bacterium]